MIPCPPELFTPYLGHYRLFFNDLRVLGQELANIGELWGFEKSFGLHYMQSFAKAGYPLK